ncbi:MAG: hypothetical protein NC251_03440 [Lachnoclostridium sp.]|nr:hypothetical protein [Lachnospira sp.]MCM1247466.1 hypothetical protein [Lachnoclostridium sp.]
MDIRMGWVNTYTYKSRNQNNSQNKGVALFDRVGVATASDTKQREEELK